MRWEYIAKHGVLLQDEGAPLVFVGAFARLEVPRDVQARAGRLEVRYGRNRHDYMAEWCARKTEADWRLQPAKIEA